MGLMSPTSMSRRTHWVRAGVAAFSLALTLAAGAVDNRAGSASRGGAIAAASLEQSRMLMTVGTQRFPITLEDNPTARAFVQLLPLVLDMEELNGNEKKFDLSEDLPTDAANPKTIDSGDLMIWQKDTLVLFYKSFPTSYSYAKLGKIDDPSGLEAAVGKGNIKVTFELK